MQGSLPIPAEAEPALARLGIAAGQAAATRKRVSSPLSRPGFGRAKARGLAGGTAAPRRYALASWALERNPDAGRRLCRCVSRAKTQIAWP